MQEDSGIQIRLKFKGNATFKQLYQKLHPFLVTAFPEFPVDVVSERVEERYYLKLRVRNLNGELLCYMHFPLRQLSPRREDGKFSCKKYSNK